MHDNIIQLKDVVMTGYGPALVFDWAPGGDLFSHVYEGPISERDARNVAFQILSALQCLHEQKIWHRDVKPENILVVSENGFTHVILSDFGFARRVEGKFFYGEWCGSPFYTAPEMVRGEAYTEKVDIWALGITLYICFTGVLPFDTANPREMRNQIAQGLQSVGRDHTLAHISAAGIDLLEKMLAKDSCDRISAADALRHPWFTTHIGKATGDGSLGSEWGSDLIQPQYVST
jgi:calcium-dependent protein kinase